MAIALLHRAAVARPALSAADLGSRSFRRARGVVMLLEKDESGREWQIVDDLAYVAAATGVGGKTNLGTPVPTAAVKAVRFALGCYTGAARAPFQLSALPGGKDAAAEALEAMWLAGLVEVVPAE